MKKFLCSVVIVSLLSGCSMTTSFKINDQFPEEVVVKAVGLGAEPNDESLSEQQRQLLAVKASKMDAYRSLVEKIYGVSVSSNVTIRSLAVENDGFKNKVEGLIQMAEVKEVRPISGGSYETTMEVEITPEFRKYVLDQFGLKDD